MEHTPQITGTIKLAQFKDDRAVLGKNTATWLMLRAFEREERRAMLVHIRTIARKRKIAAFKYAAICQIGKVWILLGLSAYSFGQSIQRVTRIARRLTLAW